MHPIHPCRLPLCSWLHVDPELPAEATRLARANSRESHLREKGELEEGKKRVCGWGGRAGRRAVFGLGCVCAWEVYWLCNGLQQLTSSPIAPGVTPVFPCPRAGRRLAHQEARVPEAGGHCAPRCTEVGGRVGGWVGGWGHLLHCCNSSLSTSPMTPTHSCITCPCRVAELADQHGFASGAQWLQNWEEEWQVRRPAHCPGSRQAAAGRLRGSPAVCY